MTKDKFAQVLLSRFMSLEGEDRYQLWENLILASAEMLHEAMDARSNIDRPEDSELFQEWAINVKELLFPEEIGDIVVMGRDNDDEQEFS